MHILVPGQLIGAGERFVAPWLRARVGARTRMRTQLGTGHQPRRCGNKERRPTCFDRFDDSAKALSQYEHLKGLWPLCVRLWIVSAPVMANDLPQPGKSQT